AHEPRLRRGGAAHGPARGARAAAERARVARLGRSRLPGQDRDADRARAAGARHDRRAGRDRRRAGAIARPVRCERDQPHLHARRDRRGLPGARGGAVGGSPVLVRPALERARGRRRRVRARRAGALPARRAEEAAAGRRVVAVATTSTDLASVRPEDGVPADARLLGLVVIGERLRPNARETVAFLLSQGVELRVLSGDRPETVAAIAREAGIPERGAAVDGRELPERDADLAASVLAASVVGRISPEGKKRVVEALRAQGRYVAMIGDGVNDVPALKASRLGIAQGSGSQMARSVADLVLVQGDFGSVPDMVA